MGYFFFMMNGSEIKDRRKRLGMSRDTLARLSGVARSGLQRIEGGSNATVATMIKIEKALDVAEREKEEEAND